MLGAWILGLTLAWSAPPVKPTLTKRQLKAEELAGVAFTEFKAGDDAAAFRDSGRALKKDADNVLAHYVRALVAIRIADKLEDGNSDRQMLLMAATIELQRVAAGDPDGMVGGLARGWLAGTGKARPSLPVPPVECPAAANADFDRAEALFGEKKLDEAEVAYAAAIAACPANPTFLTYAGDVSFMRGDVASARGRYRDALAADPCHWQAYRFLADVESREGKSDAEYAALVDALSCNPNYEEARGEMAELVATGSVPMRWPAAPAQADQAALGGAWALLANARSAALGGGASPLDAERTALAAALPTWRADPTAEPVWRLLSDADAAGHLDAALFALLLDQPLFPEFLTWRETHREDLKAYIRASLATYP